MCIRDRAYGVQFQTHDGSLDNPYATSWGVSTRLIGGIIMTHGDDKGLRLPSAVAPRQVVIVPIYRDDDERSGVLDKSNSCLLYTSDAADERSSVDLGGRRILKKKKNIQKKKKRD